MKELIEIQSKLKAPKNQFNKFGNYKYRNCEDILEALKPLLNECKASLIINDDIIVIGERTYVKATATFTVGEKSVSCSAFAREDESRKGMDSAQLTGATSSYARKYALNGLFLIDDTKDADSDEHKKQGMNPRDGLAEDWTPERRRVDVDKVLAKIEACEDITAYTKIQQEARKTYKSLTEIGDTELANELAIAMTTAKENLQ